MTYSSAHPRAVPAYERVGMHPRWRLEYWRGIVRLSPMVGRSSGGRRRGAGRLAWRPARSGASLGCPRRTVVASATGRPAGRVGDRERAVDRRRPMVDRPTRVARFASRCGSRRAGVDAGGRRRDGGRPEASSAGAKLRELGFEVIDHDRCCTTDGTDVVPQVAALHPGWAEPGRSGETGAMTASGARQHTVQLGGAQRHHRVQRHPGEERDDRGEGAVHQRCVGDRPRHDGGAQ